MRIDIEVRVYPRFLEEDTEEEALAIFENIPYVPDDRSVLKVKWEDFYDKEKADMIYRSIERLNLTPNKTLELLEKDRVLVLYEFIPYSNEDFYGYDDEDDFFDDEDDFEECKENDFPNLN